MGLKKQDIDQHFESVVAFSELEEFIDMPVKHYSSGMYMRLGFSIAVHINPDILIIDEILAVGDQAFQEKCIDHIYEMKQQGVTIILVSHSLDMIRKLCTHLVWMDNGRVRANGPSEELIQQYLDFMYEQRGQPVQIREESGDFLRMGTGDIEITGVRLLNKEGEEKTIFQTGDSMTIEMAYLAHKPISDPEFGLAIYRQDDVLICGPNSQFAGLKIDGVQGVGIVRYHIKRLPLLPAQYDITVAAQNSRYSLTYDHHNKAYSFQVTSGGSREVYGLIEITANWEWEQQPSPETLPANEKTLIAENAS